MIEVYIALGSNLGNSKQHILNAFKELDAIASTQVLKTSSLYVTKAWGGIAQRDFINAVVKCSTNLSALALLSELLAIENLHERKRQQINGPRTLDCDLLLYGQKEIYSESLIVPHPRMLTRGFVLIPLYEIAPDLILPDGKSLVSYLFSLEPWPVTQLEEVKFL
ncbi:MAG: 2-amino-4-hydroxy-6-hydroxymethyldihydropteridine diphosphokinase [Proteobacteria bacterium]|nr:2-amino-4-hydroxy-6-hydroxymethyldihydropteridine diphosphokinase [Pseudomonadota bacterium]